MKKKFTYNGQEFIFTIELNVKVERCVNGLRLHQLTVRRVNNTTDVFYATPIDDSKLEIEIEQAEEVVKRMVDLPQSDTITKLTKLGFSY